MEEKAFEAAEHATALIEELDYETQAIVLSIVALFWQLKSMQREVVRMTDVLRRGR